MTEHGGYQWVEKQPGEWWHAQIVDGEPWLGRRASAAEDVLYPPDMYVSFPAGPDGKLGEFSCLHLYRLYNGVMPGEMGEDCDYLHICGLDHLAQIIGELTELGEVLK